MITNNLLFTTIMPIAIISILLIVLHYIEKSKNINMLTNKINNFTNIHIITYENTNHDHLEFLKKSARKHGWKNIKVLGNGQMWKGFGTKIFECKRYLETLDKNDIAIIIDARDVIINGSPDDFVRKIIEFNIQDKVLFSAEGGCCPEDKNQYKPMIVTQEERQFMEDKQTNGPFKYLNAGMLVGKVKNIIDIYPYDMTHEEQDDQNAAVKYWYRNPHKIELNYNEEIFSNATWSINEHGYNKLDNGKFQSKVTGAVPVFIQTQAQNWNVYNKLITEI